MSDPFLGEIRMFAGPFAPRNWAFCDGQELAIADYQPLFSLLGNLYGGDGIKTFKLPDFRGRIPVHAGQGPGLSPHPQGSKFGVEAIDVRDFQMPYHNHPLQASQDDGTLDEPSSAALLSKPDGEEGYDAKGFIFEPDELYIVNLAKKAVSRVGQYVPHTNLMPTLCISFIICYWSKIIPNGN